MKKIALLVSFFLLLILIPIGVFYLKQQQDIRSKAAPATILSFSPSSVTKSVGDAFTIDVAIDTGCPTGSAQSATCNQITTSDLVINYNPDLVEATSITAGSFLPQANQLRNIIDPATGKIKYGVNMSSGTSQSGQGILAHIAFVAKKAGSMTLQFDPSTLLTGTSEEVNVVKNQSTGTVTITGGASPTDTPTPTATTAPANTPTPTATTAPGATSTPTPTPTTGAAATPTPTPNRSASSTPTPTPTRSSGTAATATPTPTQSASAPTSLTVSLPTSGQVLTSNRPTISGRAPAGTTIAITIESNPITGSTTANASGNWSFVPPSTLADGTHTLTVIATYPNGTTSTVTRSFNVSTGTVPVSGNEDVTIVVVALGIGLFLLGTGLRFVR